MNYTFSFILVTQDKFCGLCSETWWDSTFCHIFVPFSQMVISSFMPGIDIPTNVAIWVSKYNNFADVPGYVAFHNSTRKGYWNEATYHYHFFRTN